MAIRTGKDKLASLFLLGNTVCLSSSKPALSSNDMQRRLVLFHLTNSLVIMLKIHQGEKAAYLFTLPITLSDISLFNHDTWLTSNTFENPDALPHFPFLQEENTDKVQKIGT